MATNTYVALKTVTATGSSGTVSLTSIPSTYTDLVLVMNFAGSSAAVNTYFTFNGDTSSNYSYTYLAGSGSSASSGRGTSASNINLANGPLGSTTTNETIVIQVQNYSNTSTYKTVLSRTNVADGSYAGVAANVGLWRSTAAINQIDFTLSSGTITAGSTFSLYGV